MLLETTPSLAVVICCYTEERWQLLLAAVESVRNQKHPVQEIVVVVDHNDLLLERLRLHEATAGLVIVPNTEARGLSGARNCGVRASTADVVAFLDDDAEAAPDWSMLLVAPYADPHVAGVGGRVVPRFVDGRPDWLPPELDWVVGCTYEGHRVSRGPVRNLIGANMSFRRATLERAGAFASELGRQAAVPAGCEETELCIRATRLTGGAMFYEPEAVVRHVVPASRTNKAYLRARCRAEGRSKAVITTLTGSEAGLASERQYVTRTLPRAIARELFDGIMGRRAGGFERARAIVVALAFTVLGYIQGRAVARAQSPVADFDPALVVSVDLEHAQPIRPPMNGDGAKYRRTVALVRENRVPRGVLHLELPPGGIEHEHVAEAARSLPIPVPRRDDVASDAPLVSVVVATHDRPHALRRALDSLIASRYQNVEVIVVDNGSPSDAAAVVVADYANAPIPVLYVREERRGLARAHNRGVQWARGEIIAFTDDDVVVDDAWLDAIVRAFGDDATIGCVTGLIFPMELETPVQQWVEQSAGFGKGFERRRFDRDEPPPDEPLFPLTAGRFGSGANMAFRAEALRAIGGFDPALGVGTRARGGDDLAAFYDVLTAGWSIVYEPAAIVNHAHPREYEALRKHAFADGAGLGAYATHVFTRSSRDAARAFRNVGAAIWHIAAPSSPKNVRRADDLPAELARREMLGVLCGPFLYAAARRASRQDDWSFAAVPTRDRVSA